MILCPSVDFTDGNAKPPNAKTIGYRAGRTRERQTGKVVIERGMFKDNAPIRQSYCHATATVADRRRSSRSNRNATEQIQPLNKYARPRC